MREETIGPIVSAGPIGCDAGSNQVLHQITRARACSHCCPQRVHKVSKPFGVPARGLCSGMHRGVDQIRFREFTLTLTIKEEYVYQESP